MDHVSNLWKNMKLKPKMEVKEAKDAFIINSYIPGMRREDVDISLGNNKRTISIAGLREPTHEEQQQLKNVVQQRLKVKISHPWKYSNCV
jgi:HSP20 family molecular chaperone IbpA